MIKYICINSTTSTFENYKFIEGNFYILTDIVGVKNYKHIYSGDNKYICAFHVEIIKKNFRTIIDWREEQLNKLEI